MGVPEAPATVMSTNARSSDTISMAPMTGLASPARTLYMAPVPVFPQTSCFAAPGSSSKTVAT
jgi:hypothetical protein